MRRLIAYTCICWYEVHCHTNFFVSNVESVINLDKMAYWRNHSLGDFDTIKSHILFPSPPYQNFLAEGFYDGEEVVHRIKKKQIYPSRTSSNVFIIVYTGFPSNCMYLSHS
jgi:hypothetical protein